MVPKDADNRYDDLLSGGVPAASEDYSLEEILAEFGDTPRRNRDGDKEDTIPFPIVPKASAPRAADSR